MGYQKNKIKVFALGNPLLGDAGVGLAIGYELTHQLLNYPVDVYIEDEEDINNDNNWAPDDFIIIIKGLPSTNEIGFISQFTLTSNIKSEFSQKFNYDEIPEKLKPKIEKSIGEILIVNINTVDWTTDFTPELQLKFNDIVNYIAERIKNYCLAYV